MRRWQLVRPFKAVFWLAMWRMFYCSMWPHSHWALKLWAEWWPNWSPEIPQFRPRRARFDFVFSAILIFSSRSSPLRPMDKLKLRSKYSKENAKWQQPTNCSANFHWSESHRHLEAFHKLRSLSTLTPMALWMFRLEIAALERNNKVK